MKFECKHTKQVYEFLQENDINEMMKHDEYVALEEEAPVEPVKKPKKLKEAV